MASRPKPQSSQPNPSKKSRKKSSSKRLQRSRTEAAEQSIYSPYNGLYTEPELRQVHGYMSSELERSFRHLQQRARPRAYYLAYLFRNQRSERIWGRLGAIGKHTIQSENTTFCDLRTGSYRYDNIVHGGLEEVLEKSGTSQEVYTPAELVEEAFRFHLWKQTDSCYRDSAELYYERKSREIHYVDANRSLFARQRQPALSDLHYRPFKEIDVEPFKRMIRDCGRIFRAYPIFKDSWFEWIATHRQELFISSEGVEFLRQSAIFELRAHCWLLTRKGESIQQEINLIKGDIAELPDAATFESMVQERIAIALDLMERPRLSSYSGPVLLSPRAAGLFFHEVIGHRLEGSRLLASDEGATFQDLRGEKIAPDYVDILDDPTAIDFDGEKMIGHFLYDDEGATARPALLVEKGILRAFLTTAAPIPGQKQLNGHARNQLDQQPISRMGNLIIRNRQPVDEAELRQLFLDEIRRQNKPFGIYVKDVLGGETGTQSYDFQAFKGEIMHAVKVYPDGREEPTWGVDFVGTPLSALDSMVAMGDDPGLNNGF